MPLFRIADFTIAIEPRHEEFTKRCAAYLEKEEREADFSVSVSDAVLADTKKRLPDQTDAYIEFICIYRAICHEISLRGGMVFHAAVIEVEGKAYAFTAPSGTGKSTHISLWRRVFGEKVQMLNGDKPILREKDGTFIAYGTPWCGKEGWQRNASAPLAAICFLHRAEENSISLMPREKAVESIFSQLLKPNTPAGLTETLRLTDLLIRNLPIYSMGCNISEEAAKMAYSVMTKGKKNNENS